MLVPTIDIEIIWQTHLLRPEMYQADCLRLYRRVIDHTLSLNEIQQFFKKQAFIDTCQLYEQKYTQVYCTSPPAKNNTGKKVEAYFSRGNEDGQKDVGYSYWDETLVEFSSQSPKDFENPFSFTEQEVIMDGQWLDLCKRFMANALKKVPHRYDPYERREFINLGPGSIKRLKKSYERFLYMAAKYPPVDNQGIIPPTYAVGSYMIDIFLYVLSFV